MWFNSSHSFQFLAVDQCGLSFSRASASLQRVPKRVSCTGSVPWLRSCVSRVDSDESHWQQRRKVAFTDGTTPENENVKSWHVPKWRKRQIWDRASLWWMAHLCKHESWGCSLKHVRVSAGKRQRDYGRGLCVSEPVPHQPVLLHS